MTIPTGRPFPHFPGLTAMTRGLQGLFVIAGRPKVGKSTLAVQRAADVAAEDFPGVYFERENVVQQPDGAWAYASVIRAGRKYGRAHPGFEHLHHVRTNFDAAVAQLRMFTRGFLVVDTLSSSVGADCLAGADDLGALSAAITARMHQLNDLVNDGYTVLAVSHVGRIYEAGCPPLRALMYTAAIEQLVWTTAAVWKNPRGERFIRVLASRLPVEHLGADLRLFADPVTEALTEGSLQLSGRQLKAPVSTPASPAVRVLGKAGDALSYGDLLAGVRRVTGKSRATAARRIAESVKAGAVLADNGAYRLPPTVSGSLISVSS